MDVDKLEAALPALWARWDSDGNGAISREEFLRPGIGLAAFVSKFLLKKEDGVLLDGSSFDGGGVAVASATGWLSEPPATRLEAELRQHPAAWIERFVDRRSGRIKTAQLERGLVKSVGELTPPAARRALRSAASTVGDTEMREFVNYAWSTISREAFTGTLHAPLLEALADAIRELRQPSPPTSGAPAAAAAAAPESAHSHGATHVAHSQSRAVAASGFGGTRHIHREGDVWNRREAHAYLYFGRVHRNLRD